MRFDNPEQLKMCLENYEVANGYQLLFYKNDWRKLLVYYGRDVEAGRCAGYDSIKKTELCENESLNVNKVITRSRSKIDEGSLVNYRLIAHHYAKQLIADPFIPTLKMKTNIREKFLINVSLGQCVKEGWLAGCRKVIRLDGCFLKHTCRGKLLVAMGRDANNQMYPIAWAVVKVKNNENWCWFISLIQEDLHLETGEGFTIISNSHKGLLDGVTELLPNNAASTIVYGTHASTRVRGRGSRGGRGAFGGRGEGSENMGESSTTGMSQRGRGRVKDEEVVVRDEEFVVHLFQEEMIEDEGEIRFRLGDYEAEELGKQLAEPIVAVTPSAEPTTSATHSIDKGKLVAEPQGKKK
nr:hypothetical protein [Tanacetum cinerariifolium]